MADAGLMLLYPNTSLGCVAIDTMTYPNLREVT